MRTSVEKAVTSEMFRLAFSNVSVREEPFPRPAPFETPQRPPLSQLFCPAALQPRAPEES